MDISIIYYKYLDYGPEVAKQFYGPGVGEWRERGVRMSEKMEKVQLSD